jgi:hypothetical protein
MLGVTLFGIFLTPVFFYVIESTVETSLFSSAMALRIGRGLLAPFTLTRWGLVHLAVRSKRALSRGAPRPVPSSRQLVGVGDGTSSNGHHGAMGNGAPASHPETADGESSSTNGTARALGNGAATEAEPGHAAEVRH